MTPVRLDGWNFWVEIGLDQIRSVPTSWEKKLEKFALVNAD